MYIADIYVSEKNYALVAVGFTFTVLAAALVLLRIITRIALLKNAGVDDAFILLAMFSTLGFLIAVMEQVRYGLGDPPNPHLLSPFIQATTASVISYTICHLAIKLSISFQCLRVFITPAARRLFLGLIVYFSIYGTLCLLLTIMVCLPVAKYWDNSIPGKCLNNVGMRYAFGGINIVNDIILLVAPLPFLAHLQMPRRSKIVLFAVFTAGGVACIIAIVRLWSLWSYSSVPFAQRPVVGIKIAIWSGLECNIAIICACVPALRRLVNNALPSSNHSPVVSSSKLSKVTSKSGGSSRNFSRFGSKAPSEIYEVDIENHAIMVNETFDMDTVMTGRDDRSEEHLVTNPLAGYHAKGHPGDEVSAMTRLAR